MGGNGGRNGEGRAVLWVKVESLCPTAHHCSMFLWHPHARQCWQALHAFLLTLGSFHSDDYTCLGMQCRVCICENVLGSEPLLNRTPLLAGVLWTDSRDMDKGLIMGSNQVEGDEMVCFILTDPWPASSQPLSSAPWAHAGQSLSSPIFFLLRTALHDHPQGAPITNHQPPPPTTNCQPPTANRHQLPTANRHQPWLNI